MQVRGATLDGVEQHLVDEAHHRCVVHLGGVLGEFLLRADLEIVEVLEIRRLHAAEARVGRREGFLDGPGEFVLLDQHRLGVGADVELDLVERLQVGRVGYADIDAVAALEDR